MVSGHTGPRHSHSDPPPTMSGIEPGLWYPGANDEVDRTLLTFRVITPLRRLDALDRRDEITAAMSCIGIAVSLIDNGTDVRMMDGGLPTLAEAIAGVTPAVPTLIAPKVDLGNALARLGICLPGKSHNETSERILGEMEDAKRRRAVLRNGVAEHMSSQAQQPEQETRE